MINTLLTIGAVAIVTPFVVFLSVKLGTFAYLRGREVFEQTRKRSGK